MEKWSTSLHHIYKEMQRNGKHPSIMCARASNGATTPTTKAKDKNYARIDLYLPIRFLRHFGLSQDGDERWYDDVVCMRNWSHSSLVAMFTIHDIQYTIYNI